MGDTLHKVGEPVAPLPGLAPSKAMVWQISLDQSLLLTPPIRQVYAGIFPIDANDFPKLEESIKKVRPQPS